MLYVVIADVAPRKWISGVFDLEDAAHAYLREIPESQRLRQTLQVVSGLGFPVYLTEDAQGFRFMSEETIVRELNCYQGPDHVDDDNFCYTNLYRLVAEFRPRIAGRDEMGSLPHKHVTNETLACVARYGFAGLWSADEREDRERE